MSNISVVTLSDNSDLINQTYANAAVAGDSFDNDGNTLLHVKNGATSVTITFTVQDANFIKPGRGNITLSNKQVTVPANQEAFIGGFSKETYNDANGRVVMTYDDNSNVTLLPVKFKRLS